MWLYVSLAALIAAFALIVPTRTRDRVIGSGLLFVPAMAYLLAYTPERPRKPGWSETSPGRMCEQIGFLLVGTAMKADAVTKRLADESVQDDWREYDEERRAAIDVEYATLRQFAARALDLCVATPGTCGALLERPGPGSGRLGYIAELNRAFGSHGSCSVPSELSAAVSARGDAR